MPSSVPPAQAPSGTKIPVQLPAPQDDNILLSCLVVTMTDGTAQQLRVAVNQVMLPVYIRQVFLLLKCI